MYDGIVRDYGTHFTSGRVGHGYSDPGSAAPFSSVTVPAMRPVVLLWAITVRLHNSNRHTDVNNATPFAYAWH